MQLNATTVNNVIGSFGMIQGAVSTAATYADAVQIGRKNTGGDTMSEES
jgi:hypothetical protein